MGFVPFTRETHLFSQKATYVPNMLQVTSFISSGCLPARALGLPGPAPALAAALAGAVACRRKAPSGWGEQKSEADVLQCTVVSCPDGHLMICLLQVAMRLSSSELRESAKQPLAFAPEMGRCSRAGAVRRQWVDWSWLSACWLDTWLEEPAEQLRRAANDLPRGSRPHLAGDALHVQQRQDTILLLP